MGVTRCGERGSGDAPAIACGLVGCGPAGLGGAIGRTVRGGVMVDTGRMGAVVPLVAAADAGAGTAEAGGAMGRTGPVRGGGT